MHLALNIVGDEVDGGAAGMQSHKDERHTKCRTLVTVVAWLDLDTALRGMVTVLGGVNQTR